MASIPVELYAAVAVGIGLFIALIGLHNSGIITASKETLVTMGNLRSPNTLLAIFGLMLISSLLAWEVRGAILIGILGTTAAGIAFGLVRFQPQSYSFADITATAFHLNIRGALSYGLVEIVFVFLFVDLFDNIGTLVAVGKKAKLFDEANRIPRMNKILYCDATATVIGSLAGTSTVTSYVESAAGVAAGGRGCDSSGSHRSGADCSGIVDDRACDGDSLGESGDRDPGFSHHRDDSTYFQHRQWAGIRIHGLHYSEDRTRRIPKRTLAGVCAHGFVHRAISVFGELTL